MKTLKVILFATMVCLMGCNKEGDPGPKGDKGDTGIAGPKGDKGEVGEIGTANVIYSKWMNFDWNAVDSPDSKGMTINVPAITESFIEDGGVVLVYLKASSPDVRVATILLPYLSRNDYLSFITAVAPDGPFSFPGFQNGIIVTFETLDGSDLSTDYKDVAGGANYDIRYVLIPGGLPAQRKGTVNYSNYQEVKAAFNLRD